jgi:hypothetical protein
LIEATLPAQASWSAPHAERNNPCPVFVVLGTATTRRLCRIHASVTFGSL